MSRHPVVVSGLLERSRVFKLLFCFRPCPMNRAPFQFILLLFRFKCSNFEFFFKYSLIAKAPSYPNPFQETSIFFKYSFKCRNLNRTTAPLPNNLFQLRSNSAKHRFSSVYHIELYGSDKKEIKLYLTDPWRKKKK